MPSTSATSTGHQLARRSGHADGRTVGWSTTRRSSATLQGLQAGRVGARIRSRYTIRDAGRRDQHGPCDRDVTGVNDAPVADNDAYAISEDSVLNIPAPGVLDGDTDPDGEPIAGGFGRVVQPARGGGHGQRQRQLHVRPDTGDRSCRRCGPVRRCRTSFTYRVTDGTATSNLATVVDHCQRRE